jgi:hypothetical protein
MGGSEHSQNEFAHKNNDMNANDQYKQGPETDVGTDNPKRPELEGTDGGYVGTDVISPQEGASDDESDDPPVLPPKEIWVEASIPKVNSPMRIMI